MLPWGIVVIVSINVNKDRNASLGYRSHCKYKCKCNNLFVMHGCFAVEIYESYWLGEFSVRSVNMAADENIAISNISFAGLRSAEMVRKLHKTKDKRFPVSS